MTISLLSVALLLLFLTVALIEIYRGIKRGVFKSLISFGNILASVLLSIIFSPMIAKLISDEISINISLGSYESLSKAINLLVDVIISSVISTFVFVIVFFLIRGILALIIGGMIKVKLKADPADPGYGKENDTFLGRNSKKLGAVIGCVSAVILTMILTAPIMGTLDVANRTFDMLERNKLATQMKIDKKMIRDVETYSGDAVGNVFYHLGGKAMYHATASAEMYDEKVYILSEIDSVGEILDDFMYVKDILQKPLEAKKSHIRRIDELCVNIEDQKIFRGVLASGLSNAANSWLNDESFLGIKKPQLNTIIEPAFDSILDVCKSTKISNVNTNISTILQIYSVFLDSGILGVDQSNYDSVLECIEESDIISRLEAILEENPHMSGVTVSSISMSIVVDRVKNYDYDEEKYGDLMYNIADALNSVNSKGYGSDEEKIEALTSYAEKHLAEYGYDVPDDIAKATAEELIKTFNTPGITAEDINELFDKYSQQ